MSAHPQAIGETAVARSAGPVATASWYTVNRGLTFGLLYVVYVLAFVASPYWKLIPGPLELLAAGVNIGVGILWAAWSAGRVRLCVGKRGVLLCLGTIGALVIVNLPALAADIPWRGDEMYHVDHTLLATRLIVERLPWVAVVLVAALGFLGWCGRSGSVNPGTVAAAAALGVVVVLVLYVDYPYVPGLRRYPYVSRFFSAAPVLLAYPWLGLRPPEYVFRVVPLVAAALMTVCVISQARLRRPSLLVLSLLAIATTPVLLYYSSLLYLEMPAVFLMLVVCMSARTLLSRPLASLRRHPSWYALISIGFIKETTFPFLAVWLGCRMLTRAPSLLRQRSRWKALRDEVHVTLCVFLPWCLYMLYRAGAPTRGYGGQFVNLWDAGSYAQLLRSYGEQFGFLLAIAAVGTWLLWKRRQFAALGFLGLVFLAQAGFYMLDRKDFLGYSRFNLFALPVVLATVIQGARTLRPSRTRIAWLVPAGLLLANVAMSPICWDGARKPGWGDSPASVTEWSYPYRSACQWLNVHARGQRTLLAGLTFRYCFDYYLDDALDYEPHVQPSSSTEEDRFREALDEAATKDFDYLLFHLRGREVPQAASTHGFQLAKTFSNSTHRLLLFSRPSTRSAGAMRVAVGDRT